MTQGLAAIVGLGNPGGEHQGDRHNVGYDLVEELARRYGGSFKAESKFHGELARITVDGHDLRLLKPTTFMNRSGQSAQALASFLKLSPEQLLIAHDELDLPVGDLRLKRGGGHGGHNGLRDLCRHLGQDFLRLRIGIGHPGHKDRVTGYVLNRPPEAERRQLDEAVDRACDEVPTLLRDGLERAMNRLHTKE